jgi:hypothetical protein
MQHSQGHSCACFHFKTLKAYRVSCNPSTTKKYEQTARDMLKTPNIEVDGIDPGRSNIIYAVKVTATGAVQASRLTRNQYYRESGILRARSSCPVDEFMTTKMYNLEGTSKLSSKLCKKGTLARQSGACYGVILPPKIKVQVVTGDESSIAKGPCSAAWRGHSIGESGS